MEEVIKKAIEGGWGNIGKASITRIDCTSANIDGRFYIHFFENESDMFSYNTFQVLCDSLFWQSLGKTCGWYFCKYHGSVEAGNEEGCSDETHDSWYENALKFHEINLTEGWDKAVSWLNNLIK